MGTIGIRRALPEEAAALTELALRSKAHWGYDDVFISRCRDSLTITGDEIHRYPVFAATDDDAVIGYYALALDPPACELVALFVEPTYIREGIGMRLWSHAVATARAVGCKSMRIESDPNSEAFYLDMGAHVIGQVLSEVEDGRLLPLLQFDMS